MALFRKKPEYKKETNKLSNRNKIIMGIAVVAAVLVAYYVVFLAVNQKVVSTPAIANLTQSGTIFEVNSQQYLISLASVSKGTDNAYIRISKLPIFVNPMLNVTLRLNNITKINAGTYYANMGIQLQSIGANSVTVKVSPLFTSLKISPDSQYINQVKSTLYNQGAQVNTQGSSGVSTTISTSSTAVSTTTVSTTISGEAVAAAEVNSTLEQNYMFSLLLNFSILYANTSKCTSTLYNSTYASAYKKPPSGPNTYENVSSIVPYNLSYSISDIGKGNYDVNFTTRAHSSFYDNKLAAMMEVNASKQLVAYQNISSSGIFAGQSITQIEQDYIRASSEGACGVYV